MGKLKVREMTLYAVLGAMTFGAKCVMAGFPNIEPVSLFVMVFGATLGRKGLYPVFVYVAMELLFYGLGSWNVMYLYTWPILLLAAWVMRGYRENLAWAILSGGFGLAFGALCAPVDLVIGGWGYAVSKWISGIPFDVTHCAGNFVIALVLFGPLRSLTERLHRKMNI